MNFFEIKQIGNLRELDTAQAVLDKCYSTKQLIKYINNADFELSFRSTLAAVWCFNNDDILESVGEGDSIDFAIETSYDILIEEGAKRLDFDKVASKFKTIYQYYIKTQRSN
jgi:hypothetical protein